MANEGTQNSVEPTIRSERSFGKLIFALVVLVLAMVWSVYFTGPSGQSLGVEGFVLFGLRELVILALAIIGLAIGAVSWLKQRNQKRRGGNHAP